MTLTSTCPHCGGELAQAPDRSRQIPPRLSDRQRIESLPHGPWLDSEWAAAYCCKPTREAFRVFAARAGVVPVKRGRLLYYLRSDLDRLLVNGDRRFQLVHRRKG